MQTLSEKTGGSIPIYTLKWYSTLNMLNSKIAVLNHINAVELFHIDSGDIIARATLDKESQQVKDTIICDQSTLDDYGIDYKDCQTILTGICQKRADVGIST